MHPRGALLRVEEESEAVELGPVRGETFQLSKRDTMLLQASNEESEVSAFRSVRVGAVGRVRVCGRTPTLALGLLLAAAAVALWLAPHLQRRLPVSGGGSAAVRTNLRESLGLAEDGTFQTDFSKILESKLKGADSAFNISTKDHNYSQVFPEVPGRERRTITLAGFRRHELNARYTERFGDEYVVNGRETYWTIDLRYFLYYCVYSRQWIVGWDRLLAMRTSKTCHYTAKGPAGHDILDLTRPRGWKVWSRGERLVDAPTAGVDVISTQRWLSQELANPADFDSLDVLARCKRSPFEMIDFLRSYSGNLSNRFLLTANTQFLQGSCSNCWAITIAELVSRLLCMHSNGAWTGPGAFLSASYLTSCAVTALQDPSDGCKAGGDPLKALWWMGENGIPTGGDNSASEITCVPLFDTREQVVKAPKCPTQCTNPHYGRSLQEDLFRPQGLRYSYQTAALETALRALRKGPIGIIIDLYEDFYNYTGGTYRHKNGAFIGQHLMVAHGYTKDYFVGFNSWGSGWGYLGNYRVPLSFPIGFIIPGPINGTGPGYPYPLPKHFSRVTLGGFQQEVNRQYKVWLHELGVFNKHLTFWAGNNLMIYWCEPSRYWAVSNVTFLRAAAGGQKKGWRYQLQREIVAKRLQFMTKCEWIARSPVLSMYQPLTHLNTEHMFGWTEMMPGGEEQQRPSAGVFELHME